MFFMVKSLDILSKEMISNIEKGAPRRPGGLGDLLAGSVATILGWTVMKFPDATEQQIMDASLSASVLVKKIFGSFGAVQ